VGRSNKETLYGHLVSDQQYQDFTVRFQFQCTSGDSGFFIRTEMKEPDQTHGLQIQVGPCGSGTGGIYESYKRGWLPAKPALEKETFCYRQGQWNEMIISAHGPRVTVHVNGFKTADLNDPQLDQRPGVLALQMHSRVVNHTMFKDLAILSEGQIVPRAFLFDDVQVVRSQPNGDLLLPAAAAMSVGPRIRYQPEWGAMADFTDQDHLYWPVQLDQPGNYSVSVEWSVDKDNAGHPFVLQAGDQQLESTTTSTGSWREFNSFVIGEVSLPAGQQRVVLKPKGTFPQEQLMHVRQVVLKAASESAR
jgi:hypothetical protein